MAQSSAARKSKSKSRSSLSKKRKRAKMPLRSKKKTLKARTKKKTKRSTKSKTKPKTRIKAKARSKRTTVKTRTASAPTSRDSRVSVGDMAPLFSLSDQNGNVVSLEQFRGRNVVLYFYPKDDTPGCTKEACSFRDNSSSFEQLNAVVLGVSFDDADSHQKFISKYELNFPLLVDANKEVATKYGVYVQKNMYGNLTWGIERSTFVINRDGKIAGAFRRVNVDGHTDEVLNILQSLQ